MNETNTQGTDASALPTAELHELEAYGRDNPLKTAAEAVTAVAQAVVEGDEEGKKRLASDEGKLLSEVLAEQAAADRAKANAPTNRIPAWCKLPESGEGGTPFYFPRGRKLLCVRFRASLTDVPGRGDRSCIIWPLSVGDVRFAADRAQGNASRFNDELVKQGVRVIDGLPVDWSTGGVPNNPDQFWAEIGFAYRTQVTRLSNQLNTFNCVALVITG
jgi:hypothetical protein